MGKSELLELLRTDVSPNQFEDLIADLWTLQDWETRTTSQSNDKGIDIVATRNFPYEEKSLIQAKRYGERSKVSSPEMQKYASLKQRSGVDSVIIITTSEFTSEAKSIAADFNLKCINGLELIKIIQRLEAEELVREYTSGDYPLPTVERPIYPEQDSVGENTETTTGTSGDFITASSEGTDLSMELVALARGRAVGHYLTTEITEVEERMSLTGKRSFKGRIVGFIQISNEGDNRKVRPKNINFETEDGYQYALAEDGVKGTVSTYLQGKWKSAKWEISHGQTQYWVAISESIPVDIELNKFLYNGARNQIEIEFGDIRDELHEQNALAFSS